MNDEHPIHQLFNDARAYAPFGEANSFGFETRLRAALADADLSVTDWISKFSWRFLAAFLPIVLGFAIFLTLQNRNTLQAARCHL